MHLSNFCLNHSRDRPQLLFALIDHFASKHHQIGEKRKSRLKVRARWGAANISCLSTKRSKKWAKVCKKGQKYLQIRLSLWILITFQLLFADRHKIVSQKSLREEDQGDSWGLPASRSRLPALRNGDSWWPALRSSCSSEATGCSLGKVQGAGGRRGDRPAVRQTVSDFDAWKSMMISSRCQDDNFPPAEIDGVE